MIIEQVDWVFGMPAVVVLVCMLAKGTVWIIAWIVTLGVSSTGTPHIRIIAAITQLHPVAV